MAALSVGSPRLTIAVRVLVQDWSVTRPKAANVSWQTAAKWVARYRELGEVGPRDRWTRAYAISRALGAWVVHRIEHLRSQHLGSHRIAWMLRIASSSVYRASPVLRPEPLRMTSLGRPAAPGNEGRSAPDGKQRGLASSIQARSGVETRFGWMPVHVAVDDRSKLAYVEHADSSRQRYRRARCAALRRGSLPDGSTGSGDRERARPCEP
jgi:hypothetical protein